VNLVTFLLGMAGPLVSRVLMAIGFSVVTVVGLNTVVGQLKGYFLDQLALVPAAGLELALLSGVGTAIGIIFGAITTRMVLWQINNATRILGNAP